MKRLLIRVRRTRVKTGPRVVAAKAPATNATALEATMAVGARPKSTIASSLRRAETDRRACRSSATTDASAPLVAREKIAPRQSMHAGRLLVRTPLLASRISTRSCACAPWVSPGSTARVPFRLALKSRVSTAERVAIAMAWSVATVRKVLSVRTAAFCAPVGMGLA